MNSCYIVVDSTHMQGCQAAWCICAIHVDRIWSTKEIFCGFVIAKGHASKEILLVGFFGVLLVVQVVFDVVCHIHSALEEAANVGLEMNDKGPLLERHTGVEVSVIMVIQRRFRVRTSAKFLEIEPDVGIDGILGSTHDPRDIQGISSIRHS